MNNIVPSVKSFNGRAIRINPETRYVCLTDMAKASGKLIGNWNRLQETTAYIEALGRIMRISIIDLVVSQVGNLGEDSGTWAHPKVALRFAQWCSPDFAVQVDIWLDELLTTGKVELTQPALPSIAPELQAARDLREIDDLLSGLNPRLSQFLTDQMCDRMFSQAQLPGDSIPIRGAAEIAEQLGLPVTTKNRMALGKHMVSQGHEILKEERLCNGQMRIINCYRQTPEVEASIRAFFS